MINYDSKNWLEGITHFNSSYIIRKTIRAVLYVGCYALLVAICNQYFQISFHIDTAVFSLLGIFLSLLMAFRNNTAYDRYWEGRKQWGALINHTRGLAVLFNGMLSPNDQTNRRFYAYAIAAYGHALSDHLRNHSNHELITHYSSETMDEILHIRHVPNKIVNDMYSRAETLYKDGFIDGFQLRNIQPELQAFLNIQGACERIKATPIPFSYNFFIKLFISVYCMLLPIVLVPIGGYYAIPMTMFVAYALIGLEYISVEIEEPFGNDCNDLPTTQLSSKIELHAHEILNVDLMEAIRSQPEDKYLVIH